MPRYIYAAPLLCLAVCISSTSTPADDVAPEPRVAPGPLDRAILAEIKNHSEIMKNLQYMSDIIGSRLTGSKNLERANNWTADKMKAYGFDRVRMEAWEIPVGWERGKASMKLLEPNNGRQLSIASVAWTPGTKGKVTGDVVVLIARTKADLEKFKGKLKNAAVLLAAPKEVKSITDLSYPAPPGPAAPAKKPDAEPEKKLDKGDPEGSRPLGAGLLEYSVVAEFLKAEGAACVVLDSAKPHGLLVTGGTWPADRGIAEGRLPRVYMVHEHYSMLYRLASRPGEPTRVEVEVENKFIPGPLTVYNTVGEVTGSEKPDEIVLIGAHLDSWDLASGTTDNATGTCVVLEAGRAIAALAKAGQRPKRTIRFALFTGEEQGLHGSKKYVERHKDELDQHSVALIHDAGTGKVSGLGLHGRQAVLDLLTPQLSGLSVVEGWKGLELRGTGGSDHIPFHGAGVPGFACLQDLDEYRLTHHTQSDTFDKAKEPNLIQGTQVLSVAVMRIANLPELLPRK